MAVRVDPSLLAYITEHGDHCEITVEGIGGREAATEGLRAAAGRIAAIPHPDEPSDGLPNFVDVEDRPETPVLVFDIKDWGGVYGTEIVQILVECVEQAGFTGLVRPLSGAAGPMSSVPDDILARFEPDLTPQAFPAAFPAPSGAAQVSGTSTNDRASVSWRTRTDAATVMAEFERSLPAAGFALLFSAESIGTPTYVGGLAFGGPEMGEIMVRADSDATSVDATVYFGELPDNALVHALDDPEVGRHLRFRVGPG
jgi:hypothetical protein